MSFHKRKGTGQNITTINIFCVGEILGDHYTCVLGVLSDIFWLQIPPFAEKSGMRNICNKIVQSQCTHIESTLSKVRKKFGTFEEQIDRRSSEHGYLQTNIY